MNRKEQIQRIRRALSVIIENGATAELRVLGLDDGPQSGLFSDLDQMAKAAADMSGKAPGVFVTMNPVKRTLANRVKNRLARASSAVRDEDNERRRRRRRSEEHT